MCRFTDRIRADQPGGQISNQTRESSTGLGDVKRGYSIQLPDRDMTYFHILFLLYICVYHSTGHIWGKRFGNDFGRNALHYLFLQMFLYSDSLEIDITICMNSKEIKRF